MACRILCHRTGKITLSPENGADPLMIETDIMLPADISGGAPRSDRTAACDLIRRYWNALAEQSRAPCSIPSSLAGELEAALAQWRTP